MSSPDQVLSIEEAAARIGVDPQRLAQRLHVVPVSKTFDTAAVGPVFTEAEYQQLAGNDALLTARRAREDADAGLPMLRPVDLDAPAGAVAATDPTVTPRTPSEITAAWDAVNDAVGRRQIREAA